MRATRWFRACAGFAFAAISGRTAAEAPRVEPVSLPGYSKPIVARWLGPAQNASGIPLGGLGTGFLELRPDGRIHDTCFRNNWLKPRPPLLFRLTATLGAGKDARTLTLLTGQGDSNLPISARFLGHFPVADVEFAEPATTPASVRLRACSPFVPGDADLSNIPAALFSIRVRNSGPAPLPVRLTLQFAEQGAGDVPGEPFRTPEGSGIQVSTGKGGGYALGAAGPAWKVESDMPPSAYGDISARVTASASAKPREERVLTFVLAWFAPRWTTSDGKEVRNRYAARFADARGVASFALDRSALIEQRVAAWQEDVYTRPIPDWLKDALVNSLYALARNSVWLDDGRLLANESFTGRPVTESVACRFNNSWPLLMLYPEQEKQAIRAIAKLQAENGEIPFGLGAPLGIETAMFGAQRPILSTEFVLMCWRDFGATQDLEFLVGLYPRIKRALQYAMTLDTDDDGLINESPGSDTGFPSNQFYDSWPWFGTSSYTSGIGLAALRAGEEAAKRCGDAEFAQWCHERFERGRATYDDLLWTGSYYRLFSDPEGFRQSDTCLADQLCGQMVAWLAGMGDVLPPDHAREAIRSVVRLNKGIGLVSGVKADGSPDDSGGSLSRNVIPAEAFNAAAAALWVASQRDDASLRTDVLTALERLFDTLAAQGRTWDQPFTLASKDGTALSGHHYSGNMAIWAVAQALMGRELGRPGHK